MAEARHLGVLVNFEYEDRSSASSPIKRVFRKGQVIEAVDPMFADLRNMRGWVRPGVPNYLDGEPVDYLA